MKQRNLPYASPITAYVPHQVLTLQEDEGGLCLTADHKGQTYQVILSDHPNVQLGITRSLNTLTLLPISAEKPEDRTLAHNCLKTVETVYEQLSDQALLDPKWDLFPDGSSFVE